MGINTGSNKYQEVYVMAALKTSVLADNNLTEQWDWHVYAAFNVCVFFILFHFEQNIIIDEYLDTSFRFCT